jgi:hypothetical protein
MLVCSVLILVKLKKKSSNGFLDETDRLNRTVIRRKNKRNNQLMLMLLATNVCFIMCTLPYCVINIGMKNSLIGTNSSLLLYIHMLAYAYNSANFLFYALFSQKYRETIRILFKMVPSREQNSNFNLVSLANRTSHLGSRDMKSRVRKTISNECENNEEKNRNGDFPGLKVSFKGEF